MRRVWISCCLLLFICLTVIQEADSLRCWICWAESDNNGCWRGSDLKDPKPAYQIEIEECNVSSDLIPTCLMGTTSEGRITTFVGRSCGYVDSLDKLSCNTYKNNTRSAEVCHCNTDLCNDAQQVTAQTLYVISIPLIWLFNWIS